MSWNMECLICHKPAHSAPSHGDYQECACPECGHYKITRTAIASMESNGFRFDVDLVRNWIASQQGSGEIPVIDWQLASQLIKV